MTESAYNAQLAGMQSSFRAEFEAQIDAAKAEILKGVSLPTKAAMLVSWWVFQRMADILAPRLLKWGYGKVAAVPIGQAIEFLAKLKEQFASEASPAR